MESSEKLFRGAHTRYKDLRILYIYPPPPPPPYSSLLSSLYDSLPQPLPTPSPYPPPPRSGPYSPLLIRLYIRTPQPRSRPRPDLTRVNTDLFFFGCGEAEEKKMKWSGRDSNPERPDLKIDALTTELLERSDCR